MKPSVDITWTMDDIHTARDELNLPVCSDKESLVFLNMIHKPLQDRSIETGWDVIKDLLQQQEREEQ